MSSRSHFQVYLALVAIVLLGLGLRLVSHCGLCYGDSYAYVAAANRLNDTGIADYLASLHGIYENRLSIVFPLALAFTVLGYSKATIFVVPLGFSLLSLIVAFLLGRTLFNPRVGLLTALLAATIPLDVFYSASLLPDSFIPLYVGLTLLFFSLGQNRDSPLCFVLSGFFLFCAFQARATSGVLILPLIVAAWWSSKRSTGAVAIPAAAFLISTVTLWVLIFLLGGGFLDQLDLLAMDATAQDFVGTGEFLAHLREMVGLNGNFGFLYTLVIPMLVYAAVLARQDEAFRLPVITFLALYLFLEFGSTTLTAYQPIWKLTRFLTILSIPAAMIIAAASDSLFSRSRRSINLVTVGALAMHLFMAVSLPIYNRDQTQWAADHIYPYETTFEKLSSYEDVQTVGIVNVWWAVRGDVYSRLYNRSYEYQDLQNRSASDLEPGTTVIYDSVLFTPYGAFHLSRRDYAALQGLPEQSPGNWRLLFTVRRPTDERYPVYVYRVEGW